MGKILAVVLIVVAVAVASCKKQDAECRDARDAARAAWLGIAIAETGVVAEAQHKLSEMHTQEAALYDSIGKVIDLGSKVDCLAPRIVLHYGKVQIDTLK